MIKMLYYYKNIMTKVFKNSDENEIHIRKVLENFKEQDFRNLLMYNKKLQLSNTKESKKTERKIFQLNDWSKFNIKPKLLFAETPSLKYMFNYLKKKTSSISTSNTVGRSIQILVQDEITNTYIGLLCLSSDVLNLKHRDTFFENITQSIKSKNLMNVSCCVPLSPFGFNTNGGKLLMKLVFSREIFDYYKKKYGDDLLAISTTGINGKSVQYSRLKEIKYVGLTKGFGSLHIPDKLYLTCKNFNDVWKKFDFNRVGRMEYMQLLLNYLKINNNMLIHQNKRGIYCGYIFPDTKFNVPNPNQLKSVDEIYTEWLNRWCLKRIHNLSTQNRLKTDHGLLTINDFKDIQDYKLPLITVKI
jgi:hypothetical protein